MDWRLNGLPVRATTSQAMEATTALSRGGKDRLAAPAGIVLEGETGLRPSVAANGGWNWGEDRDEQRLPRWKAWGIRAGARPSVRAAGGATPRCERGRGVGPRRGTHRGRSGDEAAEGQARDDSESDRPEGFQRRYSHHTPPRSSATLPLFAEWTTKEPLRLSIWDNYVNKRGGVGGTPRDIAQNYGVQVAVCAMFADEPAYFAQ